MQIKTGSEYVSRWVNSFRIYRWHASDILDRFLWNWVWWNIIRKPARLPPEIWDVIVESWTCCRARNNSFNNIPPALRLVMEIERIKYGQSHTPHPWNSLPAGRTIPSVTPAASTSPKLTDPGKFAGNRARYLAFQKQLLGNFFLGDIWVPSWDQKALVYITLWK